MLKALQLLLKSSPFIFKQKHEDVFLLYCLTLHTHRNSCKELSKRSRTQPHKLLKWADSSEELPSAFLMHLIQFPSRFSQKYPHTLQALGDQFSALGSFLLIASLFLATIMWSLPIQATKSTNISSHAGLQGRYVGGREAGS